MLSPLLFADLYKLLSKTDFNNQLKWPEWNTELRKSGQTHFSCRLFIVQAKEPSSGQVSKFKSCI
jgi:hypothetical protein